MSQSVRLGRVYLTGAIVFVVGGAVLGLTLISGGSTAQHHRDDLGPDALTTLPSLPRVGEHGEYRRVDREPGGRGRIRQRLLHVARGVQRARRNHHHLRYALWWAVVTTTTVGYGDYTPVTLPGRVIATAVMIVGIGLIGTVSATVAAWFVTRHSEPVTETADVTSVDTEPAAATTADTQALLLDRLDELAAKQDEIRAMLIEPQRPPTNS